MHFRQIYVTLGDFEYELLMSVFHKYINDLNQQIVFGKDNVNDGKLQSRESDVRALENKIRFNSVSFEKEIKTPFDE